MTIQDEEKGEEKKGKKLSPVYILLLLFSVHSRPYCQVAVVCEMYTLAAALLSLISDSRQTPIIKRNKATGCSGHCCCRQSETSLKAYANRIFKSVCVCASRRRRTDRKECYQTEHAGGREVAVVFAVHSCLLSNIANADAVVS